MALTLLEDTQKDWPRMPFAFTLGEDFKSLEEALSYLLEHNIRIHGQYGSKDEQDAFKELLKSGDDKANPQWFTRPYFADTSPGGNDAINCYWQFNRDDDIVHPITRSGVAEGEGLGRVYSEMIESNQQILWMTFGVAEFGNVASFYKNAIDTNLSQIMRNGGGTATEIGTLLGSLVGFVISLPIQPFIWLGKLLKWSITYEVTKYYDFKQSMLLYYEFVNTILTHLSVNMGMIGPISSGDKSHSIQSSPTYMPRFMQKTGPDIFAIMQMRARRANPEYMLQGLKDAQAKQGGAPKWWNDFISAFGPQTIGASDFIGFRIEKSVDSNESFSNSTGESSIASTLNGRTASAIDSSFSSGGIMEGAKSFVAGAVDAFGMGGATSALMGTAFIDIPDIWKGASFGKSHSVNFKLRSPYGDPISIIQSIYLPFALLLAGALPRAAGKNSFTSPFLCRCYCKGMFSIPLGIIESLSVTRGESEYGWNNNNLPLVVSVSMSIKDLSPAIYMALGATKWKEILGQNSSFQEYLITLSGLGLNDRVLYFKNLKRKWEIWKRINKSTGLVGLAFGAGNPYYWSAFVGDTRVARTIGAIRPTTLIPTN